MTAFIFVQYIIGSRAVHDLDLAHHVKQRVT